MSRPDAHVWWRGVWWALNIERLGLYETTFIAASDREYGPTHVLDCNGIWRFNGTTHYLIWYEAYEDDLGFLVSALRIRLEYPMRGCFSNQYDRISDHIFDNNSDTYAFTIAVHQVALLSRVLKDGDHAIARRVLGCLFTV